MTRLLQYRDLVQILVARELKVRYRRSTLGFLWTMLQPLLTMTVLHVVFSQVFRFDVENYAVYALSGILFWNFFSQSITTSMNSLRTHAGLVSKLPVPKAVFPVATHSVAFAVDMGFSAMLAAWAYGLMGLASTVGRVGFGIAADRIGGPAAASLSFACTAGGALSLIALEVAPHVGWLLAFALLFGLGFGARGPIITAMASDWFGGRHFGAIYGVLNLANGIGAAIGPWFGGAVHDVTGSYRIAFASAVGCCVLGAACFWLARRPRLDAREAGVLTGSA